MKTPKEQIKALTRLSERVIAIAELVSAGAHKDAILDHLKLLDIAIGYWRNDVVEEEASSNGRRSDDSRCQRPD